MAGCHITKNGTSDSPAFEDLRPDSSLMWWRRLPVADPGRALELVVRDRLVDAVEQDGQVFGGRGLEYAGPWWGMIPRGAASAGADRWPVSTDWRCRAGDGIRTRDIRLGKRPISAMGSACTSLRSRSRC